jgi:hypothetical protein
MRMAGPEMRALREVLLYKEKLNSFIFHKISLNAG